MSDSLDMIAEWFAEEIVCNEMEIRDYYFPPELRDRVVEIMITNPKMGWPDRETAKQHYDDYVKTKPHV